MRIMVTHLAVEILPATRHGTTKGEVSPEYGWNLKTHHFQVSGCGFYKWRRRTNGFFRDLLSVTPSAIPFLSFGTEQGRGPAGAFSQAGVKLSWHQLPAAGKLARSAFTYLEAGYFSRFAGTYTPQETLLVWTNRVARAGGFGLYSEGRVTPLFGVKVIVR